MASHSDKPKQTRIFLWYWPRSISTCFEKCLSFVDGVQVWHEPFSTLNIMASKHASESNQETNPLLASVMSLREKSNEFSGGRLMPAADFTYAWVKSKLDEEDPGKRYIFIKDSAGSIYNNMDLLPDVPSRHTFIIRHPYRSVNSMRNLGIRMRNYQGDPSEFVIPDAAKTVYTMDYMHLLWKNIRETGKDSNPIIIDADDLLDYPEKILSKYLGALGIPYRESYSTWDASEESLKTWVGVLEWMAWQKYTGICDKSFASSRFLPNAHAMHRKEDLTPDIAGIIDRILPSYEEMYDHRIKPE